MFVRFSVPKQLPSSALVAQLPTKQRGAARFHLGDSVDGSSFQFQH